MTLKFMEQLPLRPDLVACPYCGADDRTGIHSRPERRLICHACKRTFAETKGTPLYGLHYPIWVVVMVLTLLAFGCPLQGCCKVVRRAPRSGRRLVSGRRQSRGGHPAHFSLHAAGRGRRYARQSLLPG